MNNLRLGAAILIMAAILLVILFSAHHQSAGLACGFRDDKTVSVNSHKINVEVASTAAARQQGLSGRTCIGQNQGMLFVFDKPGQYSFWMKDMKFPIDMVWISSAHKVVTIEENVQPSTYPDSFINPAGQPAQYVLELQTHATTAFGINPGTSLNF